MPGYNNRYEISELRHEEHQRWKDLCTTLLERGAVTQADLNQPSNVNNTPGTVLLQNIREWGDASWRLRVATGEKE